MPQILLVEDDTARCEGIALALCGVDTQILQASTLAAILGLVGVLNFVNSMVTSILARRRWRGL